jgi:uncharacterized protein
MLPGSFRYTSEPLPSPRRALRGGARPPRLALVLLLPLLWLAALAGAAEGEVQPVPPLTAPVTDLANLLSAPDTAALNAKLLTFAQEKGSQVAVLIVPTTQPETIFEYSFRVADTWKLGRKGVDDGVLLVLAVNDRKSHLQVGYGLEGAIPDIRAKQILDDIMRPYLSRGDFSGGINAGVDSVIKLINGEALPAPKAQQRSGKGAGDALFFAIIAGVIAGFFTRAIIGRFFGGLAGGGVAFAVAMLLGLAFGMAFIAAVFALLAGLSSGRGGIGGFPLGGMGGGGFGGGGFGGGGGGFGGGGASGSW